MSLPVKSALIDAEIVVQTEAGVASFTALVEALKTGKGGDLVLYAFDLLYLDGYDLREAPVIALPVWPGDELAEAQIHRPQAVRGRGLRAVDGRQEGGGRAGPRRI